MKRHRDASQEASVDINTDQPSHITKITMKSIPWAEIRSRRFITLLMGVVVELAAGTLYCFSAYGPTLKKNLDFSQTEVTMIGTLGNVGIYLGYTMGLLLNKAKLKITLIVSGLLVSTGYFLSFLCIGEYFPPKAWVLIVLYFFVGQGSHGMNVVCLDSGIRNYSPEHRGKITGILASGFGLSSALFTFLYRHLFAGPEDVRWFVLMLAIVNLGVSLIGAFVMRVEDDRPNKQAIQKESLLSSNEELLDDSEEKLDLSDTLPAQVSRDKGPWEVLKTIDFWLLFAAFVTAAAAGLMVINTIGSVYLTFPGGEEGDDTQSALVITLSVCNFAGRICFGLISDAFQHRIARPFWLIVSSFGTAVVHFLFFTFPGQATTKAIAVTGFFYGGYFAMVPTLLTIFFGHTYFGMLLGLTVLAPAIGGFSMNFLAGQLYQKATEEGKNKCYGPDCYKITFLISSLLNICGACAAAYLFYRRRKLAYETAHVKLNSDSEESQDLQESGHEMKAL